VYAVPEFQADQQVPPPPPCVGVRVGVNVGPVGVLVFVGVVVGFPGVLVDPLTTCQRAGTLGGSQVVIDVCACRHLYATPL
jgi:hypothetical protein